MSAACPYCQAALSEPTRSCDACGGSQHERCWEEFGACAACAATGAEATTRVAPCTWRGWAGTRAPCGAPGKRHEETSQGVILCPEHELAFERGAKRIPSACLGCAGVAILLASGAAFVQLLRSSPIPGDYLAGAAICATGGLFLLWQAYARVPAGPADEASREAER